MSEFYEAAEQPLEEITVYQAKQITAWADAEIETACRDLASHASLFDDALEAGEALSAHVYFGGDWDIPVPESKKPIYELLRDIAGNITCGVYPAPILPVESRSTLEDGLVEIEAVIAEIRACYRDEMPPEGWAHSNLNADNPNATTCFSDDGKD